MPFPLIAALALSAGSSVAQGLLGRKSKSQSTTTPVLSPEQQRIQTQLGDLLSSRLENPGLDLDLTGARNRGRAGVHANYDALLERIESQNARRGFGRSGVTGSQRTQLEVARANKISDLDAQIEEYLKQLQLQERNRSIEQALSFSRPQGSSTTSTSTAPLGGVIGQGLGDISFLLALSRLYGGGGAGGAGGGAGYDLDV